MREIAVGIDIGTTYTKGAVRKEDGTAFAVYRKPTLKVEMDHRVGLLSASTWWDCVKDVLRGLLSVHRFRPMNIASICISAIAPTLTVFDADNPDRAYAILYSSLVGAKNISSPSQNSPELTKIRLTILRNTSRNEQFTTPCITDLVGYLNWRLTGKLTMNSLSFVLTGLTSEAENLEMFNVSNNIAPQLVSATEKIGETTSKSTGDFGIESGISVCGGCPDAVSSMVGAGLTRRSERMLYLGTFGSVLELDEDVDRFLEATGLPCLPYRWLLSIPGMGPEIESLGSRWFSSSPASNRLRQLDQAAKRAPPGAGGTLFLVPRWKNGMTPIGSYRLLPSRTGETGNISRRARAVLEGVAYAALSLGIDQNNSIIACGGGARSQIWLDIISIVLGYTVKARHMAWEATGAADIAAKNVWKPTQVRRPWYKSQALTNIPKVREVIDDNCNRIMEVYREHDWI